LALPARRQRRFAPRLGCRCAQRRCTASTAAARSACLKFEQVARSTLLWMQNKAPGLFLLLFCVLASSSLPRMASVDVWPSGKLHISKPTWWLEAWPQYSRPSPPHVIVFYFPKHSLSCPQSRFHFNFAGWNGGPENFGVRASVSPPLPPPTCGRCCAL
jgi:hypothetical protein